VDEETGFGEEEEKEEDEEGPYICSGPWKA
jgi:hypothetical protein